MKKRLLILTVILLAFLACDNDMAQSEVPSIVKNTFRSTFPDATDVEWETYGDDFEVDFEIDQKDHAARIDHKGNLLAYKFDIEKTQIPAPVDAFLNMEHPGKTGDDPEILVTAGTWYYQIEIDHFWGDKKVIVDSLGQEVPSLESWE